MAGQHRAAVFGPGAALEPAFEQIPALPRRSEGGRDPDQRLRQHDIFGPRPAREPGADHPANQACPGLVGADRRRQLRPADRASGEEGADVGSPGDDEHPEHQLEPLRRAIAQPQQSERGEQGIDEAGDHPAGAPACCQPPPFDEHRPRGDRNKNGEDIAAKESRDQGDDRHDDCGDAADEQVVHRPPNRRWRAANTPSAAAKAWPSKSGHNVSTNISSA